MQQRGGSKLNEFSTTLSRFLFEVFVRAGMSVVERDFRNVVQWNDDDELRDDDEIDQLEIEIKKAAQKYVNQIVAKLADEGFKSESDYITRKEDLSIIIGELVEELQSDLKEGVK